MAETSGGELKKTPLNDVHRRMGAKMVEFGGWDMPVRYSGDMEEHRAVRNAAGLFDLGHMGQVVITGPDALPYLQWLVTNDMASLKLNSSRYAMMCYPNGGTIDDLFIYRLPDRWFVVVNASNREAVFTWLREREPHGCEVRDASDEYGLVAVQGPRSLDRLGLPEAPAFTHWMGELDGIEVMVARTGYTGELGVELCCAEDDVVALWDAILARGVTPCGLGARDTLRLEAAMRLHGSDIDQSTTVLEADLGWTIAWNKGDFIGRGPLLEQKERGLTRKLVGFEMIDAGIARHGYAVTSGGAKVGEVTSGTQTPFLKKAIGMTYVPPALSAPGTELHIDIRGRSSKARVVSLPFYRRVK